MGADTTTVGPCTRWGTWEELILGGAVLRHGTQDWNVVASEVRARSHYPCGFSPEACKAKYEDLQRRYTGCTSWFEELRKQRVAELKQELERSEDSIGSLESKLESLKAEKGNDNQVCYSSSRTESTVPLPKTEGIRSFDRDTPKDGFSAGSFTQDYGTNWLPGCEIPTVASAPETETPEVEESFERERVLSIKKVAETSSEQGGMLRKRRGKRKRKDCAKEAKEGSIGESDNLGSTNVVSASHGMETSTSNCGQTIRSFKIEGSNKDLFSGGSGNLVNIFISVAENKHAFVFRHRLDSQVMLSLMLHNLISLHCIREMVVSNVESTRVNEPRQKRARYKKIIRQHMDFDTIRSRIASCSIKSATELFRDLLLLANNALVFYSRRTREYKSALCLRDLILKAYRQHCPVSGNRASSYIPCLAPMCNPPVKPRSVRPRPCKRKFSAKLPDADNIVTGAPQGFRRLSNVDFSTLSLQPPVTAKKSNGTPQGYKKLGNADSGALASQPSVTPKRSAEAPQLFKKLSSADSDLPLQSLVMAKKGVGRPAKIRRGTANQQLKTPVMKERKRGRRR
ncbi:hypothetical protein RJ639_038583 [Escallonia herrerae]|uniref:Bromo domain-containing protein n=1 Tax=Escallonia herrerae TaxID=1293975 RepID=A0AA89B5F9_9ASTE|nr:hypothetical protein RJ639_038583 [Escallonia herrerae]